MSRRRLLFGAAAAVVAVAAIAAGSFLVRPKSAATQSAPPDVLEIVSGRQFEATHAIVLIPAGPGEKAAVKEDQLAARLEAEGFRSRLRETPKLVRFKGGAVPGGKGSGGLMWALVVDQPAGLSGTMGHPVQTVAGGDGHLSHRFPHCRHRRIRHGRWR